MTKVEIKSVLEKLGFTYERDSEYNRDVYTNKSFFFLNRETKLEIFVDYYTIRFVWWYSRNQKVGTSFYINSLPKNLKTFIDDVICELINKYNLK